MECDGGRSRWPLWLMAALGLALAACDSGGVDVPGRDVPSGCPESCPDEFCNEEGSCDLTRCSPTGTCAEGFYCDPEIGWCRSGCKIGAVCANGEVCNDNRACEPCGSTGRVCPPGAGVCIDGRCVACTEDADCGLGTGLICSMTSSQCVEGCRAEENCPTDTVCDPELGRCVECRLDEECPDGTFCADGVGACVECVEDADCDGDRFCDHSRSACIECRDNFDCDEGTCDEQAGECVPVNLP